MAVSIRMGNVLKLLQLGRRVGAVHLRASWKPAVWVSHHHIHNDHIRLFRLDLFEALLAAVGSHYLVLGALQGQAYCGDDIGIVVNYQI